MTAYQFSQPWLSQLNGEQQMNAQEWAHLRQYLQGIDSGTIPLFNPNFINFTINGTAFSLPVSVSNGGTGLATLTSGSYLKGAGTSNVAFQAPPIPVSDGGTNSTTALTNGLLIVSSSGKIIEIAADTSAGSHKITSLSAATTNGDALRYEQLFGGDVTLIGNLIFNPTTKGVKGTTTNDAASSGNVGEFVFSTAAGVSVTTSITNVTSITIGAGDWDISGLVQGDGSVGNTWMKVYISTTTASNAGCTEGYSMAVGACATATASLGQAVIPRYRVSLTGSTTYYLNASMGSATTNCDGSISARRMR